MSPYQKDFQAQSLLRVEHRQSGSYSNLGWEVLPTIRRQEFSKTLARFHGTYADSSSSVSSGASVGLANSIR